MSLSPDSASGTAQKIVVADAATADKWLVDFVRKSATDAIAQRGTFSMALSGGSSPLNFYRLLAGSGSGLFPWDKTHVWIVDERFVPSDHKDHNGSGIQKIFCGSGSESGPLPAANLHLIDTGAATASQSSALYAGELARCFSDEQWPAFDFVLLGMGGDGHTASLFPGTGAVDVHDRTVLTCTPLTAPHERVSLSLPVLRAARDSVFLVCGESKRDMLAKVLSKADKDFPASLVATAGNRVVFLCDEAAS